MNYMNQYLDSMETIIEKIRETGETYNEIAKKIVERFMKDGLIYAFGTGHGHLLALEIFYRAGGMMRICPILDERLMLHKSATGSSAFERTEGVAEPIFKQYDITEKDVVIIFSNSGINPLTIEMAQLAKNSGALTIALTNLNHSRPLESRHKSGLKLYDICEYVLDNYGVLGDAMVPATDGITICPSSTAAGSIILHSLTACIAEQAEEMGFDLELLNSGNVPGAARKSQAYLENFKDRVKAL